MASMISLLVRLKSRESIWGVQIQLRTFLISNNHKAVKKLMISTIFNQSNKKRMIEELSSIEHRMRIMIKVLQWMLCPELSTSNNKLRNKKLMRIRGARKLQPKFRRESVGGRIVNKLGPWEREWGEKLKMIDLNLCNTIKCMINIISISTLKKRRNIVNLIKLIRSRSLFRRILGSRAVKLMLRLWPVLNNRNKRIFFRIY